MHHNLALGALAGWLALASEAAALTPYASLGVPEYLDTFTGESAVSTLTPDVAGGLQRLREFQASRETPTPILISSGSAKFTLGTSSPTYEPPPILAEQSILSVSAAPAAGATLVGVQAKFSGATLFTIGDYASDIGVMLAQTGGTQYAGAVLALRVYLDEGAVA